MIFFSWPCDFLQFFWQGFAIFPEKFWSLALHRTGVVMSVFRAATHPDRSALDLPRVASDQVALEGLEGITLSALATRMLTAPSPCAVFRGAEVSTPPESAAQLAWAAVRKRKGMRMYRLPESRTKLVIFNRSGRGGEGFF